MLLALFVARTHCRVTLSLSSTRTRRAFPSELLAISQSCYEGSSYPVWGFTFAPVEFHWACWPNTPACLCPYGWQPCPRLYWLDWHFGAICKASEVVRCHWFKPIDKHIEQNLYQDGPLQYTVCYQTPGTVWPICDYPLNLDGF